MTQARSIQHSDDQAEVGSDSDPAPSTQVRRGQPWQTSGLRLFAWIRDHRRVSSESFRFVSTRIWQKPEI